MNPADFIASLSNLNFGNQASNQASPVQHDAGGFTLPKVPSLPQSQDPTFWQEGGGFGNVMAGFNALAGMTNAFTGLKSLDLAKDTFKFNRGVTETNLQNQANTVNTDSFARLQRQNDAQGTTNPYASLEEYVANSGSAVSGQV